jgi:DNA-binding transcriptional LysR family regulator
MNTTLDARAILQAALQLEGLGPAAKNLSRSQSTISDAIGRLQEQLGVRLFEIHKKPDVQSEGQTLGALPGTVTVRPLSVNIHSYQVQ